LGIGASGVRRNCAGRSWLVPAVPHIWHAPFAKQVLQAHVPSAAVAGGEISNRPARRAGSYRRAIYSRYAHAGHHHVRRAAYGHVEIYFGGGRVRSDYRAHANGHWLASISRGGAGGRDGHIPPNHDRRGGDIGRGDWPVAGAPSD